MRAEPVEQLLNDAAQRPVSDELESDDNLVRLWQDELREAREKIEVYRTDGTVARTLGADVRHTEEVLATLPQRIATRRAEIAYERWASETLAGLSEIPVVSMDRSFASVRKEYLTVLAPDLAIAIPKKSRLWADWSVWNFKRNPLNRATALPAEAVHRARGSLQHFERLEVWQAVGMADPWLVGVLALPMASERFYLLYDWGTETTPDRNSHR
ncbi:MAG TPA: hypothetical protein VJP06_04095 [Thermoplasmata archaeon]|nr:hypothetical protein [Thermoplasmata archaeon]